MFGLVSKRYHAGFGVEIRYSVDIHAIVKGKGVCLDDGPQSARRLLEITIVNVCRHCKSKPWIGGVL